MKLTKSLFMNTKIFDGMTCGVRRGKSYKIVPNFKQLIANLFDAMGASDCYRLTVCRCKYIAQVLYRSIIDKVL